MSTVTSRPFHAGEILSWERESFHASEKEVLNASAIAPSTLINPQQSPQG